MIFTLTLNPAIDRSVRIEGALKAGSVHRITGLRTCPGGKGLNVSRIVSQANKPSVAFLPADANSYLIQLVTKQAAADGLPPAEQAAARRAAKLELVTVSHPVRTNLIVNDSERETTNFNEPGQPLPHDKAEHLLSLLLQRLVDLEEPAWVVMGGSLPPKTDMGYYAYVLERIRQETSGVQVAVDTSGAALIKAVCQGPDLIKPNEFELAELLGCPAEQFEDKPETALEAATSLIGRVKRVLLTLGARGAGLITDQGTWFAPAPQVTVRSTVGAGDSALAGFLLAEQAGLPESECLEQAVRYGSAAASLPGTATPTAAQAAKISVAAKRLS